MGVSSILDTAKQALLAQQAALQVAGQNIANVNTPGYTRERAVMVPAPPALSGTVFRGGVSVDRIERIYDQFIAAQLHAVNAGFQSAREQADQLGRAEVLFNDLSLEDGGLSSSLERFFQTFLDLANHPQGIPERTAVQQQGTILANAFHDLDAGLQDIHRDLNATIQNEISDINRLTNEIVDLNRQIQRTEANPKRRATTLRDQRDELLRQLSEKMTITSFETDGGRFTVLLGGGRPLIEGLQRNQMVSIPDPDNPDTVRLRLQDASGNLRDISQNITGGKLQGLLAVRDTLLPDFVSRLDQLAARLTGSVNQVHTAGFGLDGSTGNNLFVGREVSAQAISQNTGGGTLQRTAVFDPTRLTLDDYRITFTANGPPPTFDIVNTTSGQALATSQPYTSGDSIRFAGIEVAIADGSGPPQAGDTFVISSTKGSARNIAIDPTIVEQPEKIAAGSTAEAGDNSNALSLADLRDVKLIDGNTLSEFYSSLVSNIGLEKQTHTRLAEQREQVVTEIENRRESLSGVSLDEEQLDLIRFQQAFTAAANFVRVADEMAQTVLSLAQ